jgi:hypothetical protein
MKRVVLFLSVVAGLAFQTAPVQADVEIKELGNVLDKVSLGMNLHTFYRYDSDPYYGAPVGTSTKDSTGFGEIFATFRLTAEKDMGWAKAAGQFAPLYTQTIDQDVYGIAKDQSDVTVDQAWLKFSELYGGPFDLTIGRQDIRIENWLVVADGEGQEQALWLNFHDSFPFGVRLDGNFGSLSTTLYWARSDNYFQKLDETALFGLMEDIEVAGINVHYDFAASNYIFAGVHQKIDDGNRATDDNIFLGPGLVADNDTTAWDLGIHLTMGGLLLEAEGVVQTGDAGELAGRSRDREAFGGFASLTYNLPVAYAPWVRGSYFYFSGEDDPADGEASDYDPMFSGFSAWNRFVIGEITGELHLPNSNKKVAVAEVGFSPAEAVFVTLMYLNHKLDENYWLFVPTSSDDWADEVNLMIDAPLNDNLFVHFGTGWSTPGDAAEEIFGDDKDNFFAQLWLNYSF